VSKGDNARAEAVAALQARLGHSFADQTLLERALTHASVGQTAERVRHNERLEFLGDRVLGLCVAEALLEQHPIDNEGDLSKRLNILVSGAECAKIARAIGVGPALRMAGGETKSGLRDNDTVLGDACEALIAAVYLDGGLDKAAAVVRTLWAEAMAGVEARGFLNPKSQLQEWAAAAKRGAPKYRVVERTGPDHAPQFTVEVALGSLAPETAVGSSRQAAETEAARAFLIREGVRG
jgi:ribonuclease-3